MSNYLERSIEQVSKLDPAHTELSLPGEHIGSGGSARTHTFGNIDGLYLALKIPVESERGRQVKMRATSELATATFLLDHCPELEPLLPIFMGIVATQNEGEIDPLAILTEDASKGNTLKIRSKPTSQIVLDQLTAGFADYGTFDDIFDKDELRNTTSFNVDGQERLLDFTPPPFSLKHYLRLPGYKEAFEDAWERAEDWTVEVAPQSPLAQSLSGQYIQE